MSFKYARQIANRFNEHSTFISNNNKNKIKVRKPDYPISAVRRAKNIWVRNKYAGQLAGHNFSSMTIIPTVALMNGIPPNVDDSCYRGHPPVILKMTATETLKALTNAAELEDVLITTYGMMEA